MPTFTIQVPDGRKVTVQADSQEQALSGVQDWYAKNPSTPKQATAPAGLQPGSREYAMWAAEQALAGNTLPMVSPPPQEAGTSFADQVMAGTAAAANAVPIAGPKLLEGLQAARGAVQGMTPEQVQTETNWLQQQNPTATTAGTVAGVVAPFAIGGAIPGVSRVLGMSGGLASQVGFGAASGGAINAADTAVRGGNPEDVLKSLVVGTVAGGTVPVVFAGAGKTLGWMTGKGVPKAARMLGRAMKDDGVAAGDVGTALASLSPDGMVMDLGPNLQRQAGALAQVPGPAQKAIRDAIEQRAKGASTRVVNDVAQTVGTGPELQQLTDQIVAGQKAAADPLYSAVRGVPLQPSGNIKFVAGTPMGKKAYQDAVTLMANDGVTPPNTLTVGLVDYMKRALDDLRATALRQGQNNVARQAGNLARTLAAEADKQVPAYAAARDAFAGPAQVLDAIEAGTTVFTKDITPGQLKTMLNGMSVSERDAFLQAARSSIESAMGNAVNDALSLRNMFKKGWNEAKLRLLLGNQVADDLMRRINREAVFGQTRNVVAGNSETAARSAAMGEVAPQMMKVHPESAFAWVMKGFNAALSAASGARQKKINDALAKYLTGTGLDPATVGQVQRGMLPPKALPLPGGAVPLMAQKPQPLRITVHGYANAPG